MPTTHQPTSLRPSFESRLWSMVGPRQHQPADPTPRACATCGSTDRPLYVDRYTRTHQCRDALACLTDSGFLATCADPTRHPYVGAGRRCADCGTTYNAPTHQ